MKEKIIFGYYNFFDSQIGDSTIVVGLISLMILLTGFISNNNLNLNKTNILESEINKNIIVANKEKSSIIIIDGKKYELILKEVN